MGTHDYKFLTCKGLETGVYSVGYTSTRVRPAFQQYSHNLPTGFYGDEGRQVTFLPILPEEGRTQTED